MKKIAFLLFGLFALNASAQVTVKPGVRAGLNLATLTNANAEMRPDFYVGGFAAIKLASFYTLQPELTYTRQGANSANMYYSDFDPTVFDYQKDYELQYVSLAVMNKFTFAESFYAIVGPSLDFKVGDNFDEFEEDDDIGLDVTLAGGIGYTLPMGLSIEARYKIGMIDIFGDIYDEDFYDENDNGNYDEIRLNSVIQLGVTYTF